MDAFETKLTQRFRSQRNDQIATEGLSTDYFAYQLNRIRAALGSLRGKEAYDILFFTSRPEYIEKSDLEKFSSSRIKSVTYCSDQAELLRINESFDLAIVCIHLIEEHRAQAVIRARQLAPVVVAWTWDNHHLHFQNLCNTALADVVIPAHAFCADKLKSPLYLLGRPVPLCTAQWARAAASGFLAAGLNRARSNSLHGGYIMWTQSPRNAQLRKLKQDIENNSLDLIEESDRERYFQLTAEDKFKEWSSYKVSIQIPFDGDLSLRVFDALLTGQIPVVPTSCYDLDHVISPAVQEKLPIIRVSDTSPEAVTKACKEGLERFNSMGTAGVLRRHKYANQHHQIASRIREIAEYVSDLVVNVNVKVKMNQSGVGLVQDVP